MDLIRLIDVFASRFICQSIFSPVDVIEINVLVVDVIELDVLGARHVSYNDICSNRRLFETTLV
jgi:hypothetical protein